MGKMKTVQREAIMCHSGFGPAVKTGFMRSVEKTQRFTVAHMTGYERPLNFKTKIISTNSNHFHANGCCSKQPRQSKLVYNIHVDTTLMMKFATTTMTIGIGEVSKALHDGDLDSSSQRQRGTVPHTSCNQRHAREAHTHLL